MDKSLKALVKSFQSELSLLVWSKSSVTSAVKAGERGMQYAQKRELDQEILDHFKIGYAPKAEDLADFDAANYAIGLFHGLV